jgi:glucose/arabinose dehydrogenase
MNVIAVALAASLLALALAACGGAAAHQHTATPAPASAPEQAAAPAQEPYAEQVCQRAVELGVTIAEAANLVPSLGPPTVATMTAWHTQLGGSSGDLIRSASVARQDATDAAEFAAIDSSALMIDFAIIPAILPGADGKVQPASSVDWAKVSTSAQALENDCTP